MDPKLAEFLRTSVGNFRPVWLAGFQMHLRRVIAPQLDRVDELERENVALKAEVERLKVRRKPEAA